MMEQMVLRVLMDCQSTSPIMTVNLNRQCLREMVRRTDGIPMRRMQSYGCLRRLLQVHLPEVGGLLSRSRGIKAIQARKVFPELPVKMERFIIPG